MFGVTRFPFELRKIHLHEWSKCDADKFKASEYRKLEIQKRETFGLVIETLVKCK